MRLSDIIKASSDAIKEETKPLAPAPKASPPSPPSKRHLDQTQPKDVASNPQDLQKQQELEREFRERLVQRTQSQYETKNDEITQKINALKLSEEKLENQREAFKKEQAVFLAEKKKSEETQSQNEKGDGESSKAVPKNHLKEQAAVAEKKIAELEQLISRHKEELKNQEGTFLTQAKFREDGLKNVIDELKNQVDSLKSPPPVVEQGPPAVSQDNPAPKERVVHAPFPRKVQKEQAVIPIPAFDKKAEARARETYSALLGAVAVLFEQVSQGAALEMEQVKRYACVVVEEDLCSNATFISLVHEPYPDEDYFARHAVNCGILCAAVALDFSLSDEQLESLTLGALLHDIGLVNVREDLDYPKEISKNLKKEVKNHPEKGAALLAGFLSEDAIEAIQQHHECCDGRGYPAGLKASEISLFGKILNLVDSFEAMTHQRPYRKTPLSVSAAVKTIITEGKSSYDKAVLKAMMNFIGVYPIYSRVELSNKKIAKILKQNRQFPLSPVVQIEFDEWGHKVKDAEIVDLSESRLIHIAGPLKEAGETFSEERTHHRGHHKKKKHHTNILEHVGPLLVVAILFAMIIYFLFKA